MTNKTNSRLHCSKCGVGVEAACTCNVGYITAGEYALAQAKAHPEKSSRSIAEDTGVARATIDRARAKESGGSNEPPEKRRGKDGKSYPAKRKPRKPRNPGEVQTQRAVTIDPELWQAVKSKSESLGMSAAALLGELAAKCVKGDEEPEIDVKTLSLSAQEKLAAAERQLRKKVFWEAEEAARVIIAARLEEKILPALRQREADARRIFNKRKGVMSESDYRVLLRCLHPDTRLSASTELLTKAYSILDRDKILLLAEKDLPTPPLPIPTFEEMQIRRGEVRAAKNR